MVARLLLMPEIGESSGLTAGKGIPGIGLGDRPRWELVSLKDDRRDGVMAGGRIGRAAEVGVPGALGEGLAMADPSGR